MKEPQKLTEELKVTELEVDGKKSELNTISTKLNIAYQYEEDLLQRLEAARKDTVELRMDFVKKTQEINECFVHMKRCLEIYTGNEWFQLK